MDHISAACRLGIVALIVFAACGKPIPERPAGSMVERYNRGEELIGEYAECMKIFGPGGREDVKNALDDILKRQRPDGSWACRLNKDMDPYDLFHPSWTSNTALHYRSDVHR